MRCLIAGLRLIGQQVKSVGHCAQDNGGAVANILRLSISCHLDDNAFIVKIVVRLDGGAEPGFIETAEVDLYFHGISMQVLNGDPKEQDRRPH